MFVFLLSICSCLASAPKAVVFDYGGVLTEESDPKPAISFLCKTLNLSSDEFAVINRQKKLALKEGKFDAEFWQGYALERKIDLPLNWHERFVQSLRAAFPLNREMIELAQMLKSQVHVALFSNIDMRRAEFVRGWGDYDLFDTCVLSYQIGVEKPHPRAYEILLHQLDLSAGDVVFIDDMIENVAGAKEAGIDAILFQSARQVREELHKRGL